MPKYVKKPDQKIVYFEPLFRELGKSLDDMLNWIIDSFENAPDEVREQILQKLKEKEERKV